MEGEILLWEIILSGEAEKTLRKSKTTIMNRRKKEINLDKRLSIINRQSISIM